MVVVSYVKFALFAGFAKPREGMGLSFASLPNFGASFFLLPLLSRDLTIVSGVSREPLCVAGRGWGLEDVAARLTSMHQQINYKNTFPRTQLLPAPVGRWYEQRGLVDNDFARPPLLVWALPTWIHFFY